jgi:hypothetical protein
MAVYPPPQLLGSPVRIDNLASLSYIGLFPVAGAMRSDDGDDWFLYGKQVVKERGAFLDTTVCMVSPNVFDFKGAPKTTLLHADAGAHNFCVIEDPKTYELLLLAMGPDFPGCTAFAVGGQYRSPEHVRSRASFDGIYLYTLIKDGGAWSARRCQFLIGGDHPGVVERRPKCHGYGEFDGQSSLVYFGQSFRLFSRVNASAVGGFRGVQVAASPDLRHFSPCVQVCFPSIPEGANVYFAHPYVVLGSLLLVMPIAFEGEDADRSGIHIAQGREDDSGCLTFAAPVCIFPTPTCNGRTVDVNVCAALFDHEDQPEMILWLHRWVRSRMDMEMASQSPDESLEMWRIDLASVLDLGTSDPADVSMHNDHDPGAFAPKVLPSDCVAVPRVTAPADLDLPTCDAEAKELLLDAQRRRLAQLAALNRGRMDELTHAETQTMWLKWQKEWAATQTGFSTSLKCERGKFGSYIHQTLKAGGLGSGGEKMLRVFLQTGASIQEVKELLDNDRMEYAIPPNLVKAERPTDAQEARKMRRKLAYAENKATVYFHDRALCQRCGSDNEGELMRICHNCGRDACMDCLPDGRLCCSKCPATDVRSNNHVSSCQKCAWTYYDGTCLNTCLKCRLLLCEWCSNSTNTACKCTCPAKVDLADPERASPAKEEHKHARRFAQVVAAGHLARAAHRMSHALPEKTAPTASERLLQKLAEKRSGA